MVWRIRRYINGNFAQSSEQSLPRRLFCVISLVLYSHTISCEQFVCGTFIVGLCALDAFFFGSLFFRSLFSALPWHRRGIRKDTARNCICILNKRKKRENNNGLGVPTGCFTHLASSLSHFIYSLHDHCYWDKIAFLHTILYHTDIISFFCSVWNIEIMLFCVE